MSTTDLFRLVLSVILAISVATPLRAAAAPPEAATKTESKAKAKTKSETKTEAKDAAEGDPTPADDAAEDEPEPAGGEAAEPASVDAALEAGDLASALEAARVQRKAEPTAARWHQEARILEQMGNYADAKKAYRAQLDALPKQASEKRQAVLADLERVEKKSRGTVPDEPASTHREQLDEQWKAPPKPGKTPGKTGQDLPTGRDKHDRIITKWYFWVTVAAIVASAAAVTGIAIKASRDDKDDALDLMRQPSPVGPTIIRF